MVGKSDYTIYGTNKGAELPVNLHAQFDLHQRLFAFEII